jgi:hypothetical protein
MPSLPSNNRFSVLSVDTIAEIDRSVETVKVVQPLEKLNVRKTYRPRWERSLPSRLIISSLEDAAPRSLKLKVSIEATDTGEVQSLQSLVDSGATSLSIASTPNRLTTRTLSSPIPVFNVDRTPKKEGSITEVVDLILRYKNHSERSLFAVTGLSRQSLILGHSWLQKHNPEIDWVTGDVKMSRCSARCFSGCRDEMREEWKIQKTQARCIARCSAGGLPALVEDLDEEEEGEREF